MKKLHFFVVISVALTSLFLITGCDGREITLEQAGEEKTTLFNTKWKLVGFFDIEKNELIEPVAKDCEECYTLEFMADSIHTIIESKKGCYLARGYMVNVAPLIYYTIDYQNSSFNVEFMLRTLAIDQLDGERYADGLYGNKFELRDNELKLYYEDDWAEEAPWPNAGTEIKKPFYLLFKRGDFNEK